MMSSSYKIDGLYAGLKVDACRWLLAPAASRADTPISASQGPQLHREAASRSLASTLQ